MSPLVLIQRATQRKQRLDQAQFLMAKAYRGVPYSAKQGNHSPQVQSSIKQYRGIEYYS